MKQYKGLVNLKEQIGGAKSKRNEKKDEDSLKNLKEDIIKENQYSCYMDSRKQSMREKG